MTNNSASQLGMLIVGALFIVSSSIGFFVMVHERQRSIIEELSRRDVLTGVLVRRAFLMMHIKSLQSIQATLCS